MTSSADRYSAFISYRHRPRDRHWALRIMAALETYRTPKPLVAEAFPPRIGHLFRDEDEIPSSHDLTDQIKDALVRSDNLIVICSPDTPNSRWVRREIELFQKMGKSDRIFPVLIAGEPEESFPPELRQRRIWRELPDGKREETYEEVEPIAADVRPRKDESAARTERRALLRLAATLLGCRFDDLARRDEERRKAKLRQQLGAATALLAVAATGGLWWWDANLRVKTKYCAGYRERWVTPLCVGELSAAEQKVRTATFRFHIQGGRVLDMARVNGVDLPTGRQDSEYEDASWASGAAVWHFAYRSDARALEPLVTSVVLSDEKGKQLRQIGYEFSENRHQAIARFDRGLGLAERQSAQGSGFGLQSTDANGRIEHSEIGQHRLSFDEQGFLLRREFEPVGGGERVADGLGAYGRSYEFSANGLSELIRNLDATGQPLVQRSGIVSERRSYSARGELTSVEWMDANGKPRNNEQWYAKMALVRNENGNVERQDYLSESGAPTVGRDGGYASLSRKYDEHGNQIEQSYFGIDGRPVLEKNGVARIVSRNDERGYTTEVAFFGIDGKSTSSKYGYARRTMRFDVHGNPLEVAYYGADGKPALENSGNWRVTKGYDDRGNQIEEAYFDIDGRPTLIKDGFARITWGYDEFGNKSEQAFFDAHGKPALSVASGIARMTWQFDQRGNLVRESYFDVDGKPVSLKDGGARVDYRYDGRGNQTEVANFGVDGQPTLSQNNFARRTISYDEHGNVVEVAFFGL